MLASRRSILVFTLAALPFIVGSSCAVFFSSGSSDRRDKEEGGGGFVVVTGAQLGDPVVSGLAYESGSVTGTTGENGEFSYTPGEPVQFSVGDIKLGSAVAVESRISVADLVQGEARPDEAEINIRRLLKSLDAEPEKDVITIPAEVQAAAVLSNDVAAAYIEFLDFTDPDSFASTASQLVAILTTDYPFTAVLVDADAVEEPVRSVSP